MLLALLLAQTAATTAEPACPAVPAALPRALAGWTASADNLSTMKAVSVATIDPATVRLADVPPPTRPGRMALASFGIKAAGTYGIALDRKGWIDVYRVGDRTPLASIAHGQGPRCSGIVKIVRFAFTPGQYRVVVGGLDAPRTKLLLVRGD